MAQLTESLITNNTQGFSTICKQTCTLGYFDGTKVYQHELITLFVWAERGVTSY